MCDQGNVQATKPRNYTKQRIQWTINYLSAKHSLKELRKIQSLIIQEQNLAFEQKNDNALADLQMMERITAAVIDKEAYKK